MEAVMEKPKKKKKSGKRVEKAIEIVEECSTSNTKSAEIETDPAKSEDVVESNKKDCEILNEISQDQVGEIKSNVIEDQDCKAVSKESLEESSSTEQNKEKSFHTYLTMNKQLLSEVQTISSIEPRKLTIKPYTEEQLSALYTNREFTTLEQFTQQFIEAELKGLAIQRHPLYELLKNYQKLREKMAGNSLELEQFRKEYNGLQTDIWSINTVTATGRNVCNDGTIVSASYTYTKCTFHRAAFQNVIRVLGNIKKLVHENHVLYSYSAEDCRLQIEIFLQNVLWNCMNVTQLGLQAPVVLVMQNEPLHIKPYLNEIRICISILFAFQRKLIRDNQFVKETRQWLGRLVAILLRLANYQDHLFILNHVLRCPAGVGSWGSQFVQVPLDVSCQDSPFVNDQINHVLTILATILTPIQKRDAFLEEISQKDTAVEALWVMVDSDGEEDDESSGTSLRENDLVTLINQLPLDNLFRLLLLIDRKDFQDFYSNGRRSEHHILKYFSFSTFLLRIVEKGLRTYDQAKYKQFAKRLSRFIRHITQYATDQWEQFKLMEAIEDDAMLQRLQVEYDAFFQRAIYCLYSSQKLGAWQFLAVIPYHLCSTPIIWKIYYFLHNSDDCAQEILNPLDSTDYSKKLWDTELRQQLEEKLGTISDDEAYYLLNTFANMALARKDDDSDFIYATTMDLLEIGFISEVTQEICSKSSRILLTHITSKHPHLLSNILKTVKNNIQKIDSLVLDLYEELPLKIWEITDSDLEIISKLLLTNTVNSIESKLARMILSRLNWDVLPYERHCEVAILVCTAVDQEVAYANWGWQTILRLKLHINDKGFTQLGKVEDVERFRILSKGIRQHNPLASFVTVLMTTWGHLVPLICTQGLSQLLFLQIEQKHEAVLFALYVIVPLFVNSQECIINCEKFQTVLSNLINADRGYISMARSLLLVEQNSVLQQFGNMIEAQIANFRHYGLESPRCLVRLWVNSLISIPNWNKDVGVLYLLDVIVKTSFFYSDCVDVIYNVLRELQQCSTPPEQGGTISSLFKWVTNNNVNGSLITNSLSTFPWLAYLMIAIDHEEKELKNGIWKEILIQLGKQQGKVNVDQAIKKAAGTVKSSSFSSAFLCIYRWAQQAIDTPIDHPLLPLLWQKFFVLYLTRVTLNAPFGVICVGEKFFDGLVNFTFLKKIKRRLQETIEYYEKKVDERDIEQHVKELRNLCLKIFRAYLLWLEEPRLQDGNLHLNSLPPQYEPVQLGFILQGSTAPWYEYLDYEKLRSERDNSIRIWRISNFRENTNVNKPLLNPGNSVESSDPVERILRRLTSYDAPKPPPPLSNPAPIIPTIHFGNKEEMFKSLEQCFKILTQFAHDHCMKLSEHTALNCSYNELIPQLYKSVPMKVTKVTPCKGRNQIVDCSGAAHIVIEVQEARMNDGVEHQLQVNRNSYEALLGTMLKAPALSLCTASVTIQQAIKLLQLQLSCNPATAEMGVELFYHILSQLNEETSTFLPTKTLFAICLEKLGTSHVTGFPNEMPRLLQKILQEPNLGCYLAPHFSPNTSNTVDLLFMYSTICKEIGEKYDISFTLISKFDIDNWLVLKEPMINQRSQFIETVINALTRLGNDLPIEAMMLHGLYRQHLITVFKFQFPEHYGDILLQLLKHSNGSSDSVFLSLTVWEDIINLLSQPVQLSLKNFSRDNLREYGQSQRILQHQQLIETSQMLAQHFTSQRFQYGLYGLYPKCRNYIDVFVMLLGMTSHGLVVSMTKTHQDLPPEKLSELIWPFLRDMFAPWLIPYSMQHLKDNMAAWIQELADDRSILLPWIPADEELARKIIGVFCDSLIFVIHTHAACHNILSLFWQWYCSCYTHAAVKEHVLFPIHETFVKLPWMKFWPSVGDVELMLRVIDQYLPECHSFLGHIFMSVQWPNWLKKFDDAPNQIKSRVYQCYLNLLIKLLNEPNVRKRHSEKAKSLLVQSEDFNWGVIDATIFQHVMDWYVMSCNPAVIFKSDPLDLDYRVLQFLKTVSGYNQPILTASPDESNKRLTFVRSFNKLISVYTSKHKTTILSKEKELYPVINRQICDFEYYVQSSDELTILLQEVLSILNINLIRYITVKIFNLWIMKRCGDDMITKALFQTLGVAVVDNEILAELLESTISSYFQNIVDESFEPTWIEISQVLNITKKKELEQTLVTKGSILTLYAIFLQRSCSNNNLEALLNTSLGWIETIKINESTECKVPLIWSLILKLSLKLCDINESTAAVILSKFAHILIQLADVKGPASWGRGLLNAIGISTQGTISLNFRFLCRCVAGYVLAQLPEMRGEPQVVRRTPNSPCKVGQPGGNSECVKLLMSLDFGQGQGKIKECAEVALKQIQDPGNSLHNVGDFLQLNLKQFYMKTFLKEIG